MEETRMIDGLAFDGLTGQCTPQAKTVKEAIEDICQCLEVTYDGFGQNLELLQIVYDLACCVYPAPQDYPALRAIAERWKAHDRHMEDFFATLWERAGQQGKEQLPAADSRPPLCLVPSRAKKTR